MGQIRKFSAVAVLLAVALCGVLEGRAATPAGARWAYGFGVSGIDVDSSVCPLAVSGRVGLTDAGDATTYAPPPGPYGSRTVDLYVADFPIDAGVIDDGVLYTSDGGTEVSVPRLTSVVSSAPKQLTPIEWFSEIDGEVVYAAAAFSFALAPGALDVGQYIAVHDRARATWAAAQAVDCSVSGTVTGLVRDGLGLPLRGVEVRVGGLRVVTGTDGRYTATGVPPGTRTVRATTVCRPSTVDQVNVVGGSSVTRNLTMGTLTPCSTDAQQWDETPTVLALTGASGSAQITLPFNFQHYTTSATTARVFIDGYLTFSGSTSTAANGPLPSAAAPNDAVYAFWDDLVVDASASVRTGVAGTAPNRRFTVEWRNVHLAGDPSRRLRFQVVLFEGNSQRMRLQYRDIDAGTAEDGRSATVGLENSNGLLAKLITFDTGLLFDGLSIRPK